MWSHQLAIECFQRVADQRRLILISRVDGERSH
jgi:hypothetical protein